MTRFVLALAALLGLSLVSPSYAATVALWSGNGDATDSVAGRNGTLQNGASFGPGVFGQAFALNGANNYVSVSDDNVWTFGSSNFTIALWANFDTIRGGSVGTLPNVFIGHDQGGGSTNKWVFFYGAGKLGFHINGGSTPPNTFFTSDSFDPGTGA